MTTNTARRLTYSLPPRDDSLPEFAIPSLQASFQRRGRSQPLLEQLSPSTPVPARSKLSSTQPGRALHPRHTLPVTSLALDTSTCVQDKEAASSSQHVPRGILYTGGRDGLLAAWELELPLKKRRGHRPPIWDGWHEDSGDDVVDHHAQHAAQSQNHGTYSTVSTEVEKEVDTSELPLEQQWQIDPSKRDEALPSPRFRQCVQSHTDWINDILLCNSDQTGQSLCAL